MNKWIFFVSCLLAASASHAQGLVDLQQNALANRAIIQRYQLNFEKSRKDIQMGKSGFYPGADLSYTINILDDSSLLEDRENSSFYGGIRYNLFNGFHDRYALQNTRLLSEVEAHRLQGIKQDIMHNVAQRYLEIFSRRAALQVAKDSRDNLQKVYADAANRFQVGMLRKNELLKFRVDLDNADITLKKAEASLRKSVLLLEREIDARIVLENLQFSEFDILPTLDDPEQLENEMYEKRSELKALAMMHDAALAQIEMQSAAKYPAVNLSAGYSSYDDALINGIGDKREDEIRGRLTVTMNLFDGYAKEARIGKAEIEARALSYDLEEAKKDLAAVLHTIYLDYQISRDNIAVAERSIEQAEENLRVTRLAYREGMERESDLLDAIANLSRAKYNFVAAKSDFFANSFQLTRMVDGF
ncbi:MAG: TolC family protein [Desulfobulbaceae bacterium]|nr:TolC family protein [Desulfobulbaceae bacterium]